MIQYRSKLNELLPEKSVVAEIGCAEGYYSSDILRWSNVSKLYMVDNWGTISGQHGDGASPQGWHEKNYSDAMLRVNFAREKVKVLRGISWDMARNVDDEELDLLYIDCCHSYACVKADINAWISKVKKGGIVAFHDYENKAYGVKQAVEEHCNGKYQIHLLPENKPEDAGAYFVKQ